MSSTFGNLVEGAARGLAQGFEESLSREGLDEARDQAEKAYEDRNLLSLSMAVNRKRIGCDAGYYYDGTGSDWPVIWFVLPTGQVSHHVPPEYETWLEASCLENETPVGGYDGHSRETKNKRLLDDAVGISARVEIDDNVRGQR
ncbi:hypothetical protein [Haloarchaeobius sp. TZWWS8]|uniref:hypothetical protein n=1 Tax=Haloarchaeobius sp. TZWWS8 TaxID=3446121 RepID=UPI003EB8E457